MLDFFDTNILDGTASLYTNHITLNKSMVKYFDDAYKVRVGIDKEKKEVYIFMINKDYALSGEIPESSLLSVSISNTYARICSRAMVEYICSIFGLTIEKKSFIRYNATYNEKKKAIIIDMKGEVV